MENSSYINIIFKIKLYLSNILLLIKSIYLFDKIQIINIISLLLNLYKLIYI